MYSIEALIEAKKQIESTLHKVKEACNTMEAKVEKRNYKSQITLAKRRMEAFEISIWLLDKEIKRIQSVAE